MKKKYSIELHSAANTLIIERFAVIIANQNAGVSKLDLLAMEGYFKAHCSLMDYPQATTFLNESEGKLSLFMKPEEPFITIEERVVHELATTEAN